MSHPRLVIVSNHCVSQTDANGRSMLNLLGEFDSSSLFQIYTANDDLSKKYCNGYLRLTNKNAVRGILGLGKEESFIPSYIAINSQAPTSGSMKNSLTMLLRDLVWRYSRGMSRVVRKWAKKVKPDAVVLQLGDSANLIWIALIVAKCCKIPIITYNTEDYYFKNYDYMRRQDKGNLLFNLFQNRFRRYVRKLFKRHKTVICNCDGLKKLFDDEFKLDCKVVYTASNVSYNENSAKREDGAICYCGNLGVGRHKSLVEIGNALQQINQGLKLDVYGNAPTKLIQTELEACKGIDYHGAVSYEKVQDVMNSSRLLIHVEGFDPYTLVDTRYAFSTKLADYCRSGIPMLVYAPASGEGMKYIASNKLGFTAFDKDELTEVLKKALFDINERGSVADNAVKAALSNHDFIKNGRYVCCIVNEAIKMN